MVAVAVGVWVVVGEHLSVVERRAPNLDEPTLERSGVATPQSTARRLFYAFTHGNVGSRANFSSPRFSTRTQKEPLEQHMSRKP